MLVGQITNRSSRIRAICIYETFGRNTFTIVIDSSRLSNYIHSNTPNFLTSWPELITRILREITAELTSSRRKTCCSIRWKHTVREMRVGTIGIVEASARRIPAQQARIGSTSTICLTSQLTKQMRAVIIILAVSYTSHIRGCTVSPTSRQQARRTIEIGVARGINALSCASITKNFSLKPGAIVVTSTVSTRLRSICIPSTYRISDRTVSICIASRYYTRTTITNQMIIKGASCF